MKRILAMTVHNRTVAVINAVLNALRFPGNDIDAVAVCYDRPHHSETVHTIESWCSEFGIEYLWDLIEDGSTEPRCPSRAWNKALDLIEDSHAFCISSDVVLAPHSIGMAYHMAEGLPEHIIVGKTEHCGTGYSWSPQDCKIKHRTITSHRYPGPLGFNWMLPMKYVRTIGGYDEAFMGGLCYEDDDFFIRMWNSGAEVLFCDDICGFHLEHSRDHLKDDDGKVTKNCKLFEEKHGDSHVVHDMKFAHHGMSFDVAMSSLSHGQRGVAFANLCAERQREYKCSGQS